MALKQPLCPKCGEPVIKNGESKGVQRYAHKGYGSRRGARKNLLCLWHGTNPVHRDEVNSRGIDRRATLEYRTALNKEKDEEVRRYVVTSAQNATPVNEAFFESLKTYCKENDARLIVIPFRYKNPTSMWSAKAKSDDWWAESLTPYILDRRISLNDNLMVLADIKTQPTANRPLQGFETLTGGLSAIIGHPKLELTTVATPQQKMSKILTTTGAVTVKNYIPSKAGKKGEHHHTFGACVVEIRGKIFHMRQINATRDGSFIDLLKKYDGKTVSAAKVTAIVMGDSHVEFMDPEVSSATFNRDKGMVAALKPEFLVWHDTHDFYARSHHHRGDVFINLAKHREDMDDVEVWLRNTFKTIDSVTPKDVRNIFVASNHVDHLGRWLRETDPRSDVKNCLFWAKTFVALCEGTRMGPSGAEVPDAFVYWAKRWLKCADRCTFLDRNKSFTINGIEVGFHGDKGINGSKGTRRQFAQIGVKTFIGHSHSPGIQDGCYQVGTSGVLDVEYQKGPSSWLHTHGLIYENGKRTLINIINGEWKL